MWKNKFVDRNKKIFTAVMGAVIAVLALWFFLRFVVGGPEDDWICDKGKGQWVKHGNPIAPMPTEPCGEKPQGLSLASNVSERQAMV